MVCQFLPIPFWPIPFLANPFLANPFFCVVVVGFDVGSCFVCVCVCSGIAFARSLTCLYLLVSSLLRLCKPVCNAPQGRAPWMLPAGGYRSSAVRVQGQPSGREHLRSTVVLLCRNLCGQSSKEFFWGCPVTDAQPFPRDSHRRGCRRSQAVAVGVVQDVLGTKRAFSEPRL